MMFGLNTAVRGLLASQRALYTTSHNVNNANTKGYSRQKVDQRATNPYELPGLGFLGTGTEVYNVGRIRDSFVDFKYWSESAPMGEWDVKKTNLVEIEKLMGEPSNNSFRQYMDDFYKSLDDMSKNPSDVSFREPVRENAMAFTKHLNETAKRLENMRKDTESEIEIKVNYINSLSTQIAGLNKQIYSAEISGKPANDLRDRRELLVDDLSRLVDVKVKESDEGKYNISVGGISIVNHINTNKISFKEEKDAAEGEDKFKLTWENGGQVKTKSGELKGLMDMLTGNGENNSYRGIPYYQEKLDEFAKGYADKFNEQHRKGVVAGEDPSIDPEDEDGSGIDFFVGAEGNITAANISINQKILEDINMIAAGETGHAEDARNILELIKQREDKTFFPSGMSQGTPDDFIKSILSTMSVDSLQANRVYAGQDVMQQNIASKRNSISGVSLEEEMADMVKFQHVYVAASKMITTMDTLLDLTVNRLGLVGR